MPSTTIHKNMACNIQHPRSDPLSFQVAPQRQGSSMLMTLPGEVRNKILRNLMSNSAPILPRTSYQVLSYSNYSEVEVSTEYLKNVARSSQILRCCQNLYHEAIPILYQENTLWVIVGSLPDAFYSNTLHLSALDTILKCPTRVQDLETADTNIFSQSYIASHNPCPAHTQNILKACDRFSRVQLYTFTDDQEGLFVTCFLLRDFLLNKKVHIRVSSSLPADSLRSYLSLRCCSVDFRNYNGILPPDIVSIITGSTEVKTVQYVATLMKFYRETFDLLPAPDSEGFEDSHEDGSEQLTKALCNHDFLAFDKVLGQIQAEIEEWNLFITGQYNQYYLDHPT